MTLSRGSTELAALRAELLDLMASMPETPAEARANAQRIEEIRSMLLENQSSDEPAPPEVKAVDIDSVSREIDSVSSEIGSIKARIQKAIDSSDFESVGKLSMEASLLEERRKALKECLDDLSKQKSALSDR